MTAASQLDELLAGWVAEGDAVGYGQRAKPANDVYWHSLACTKVWFELALCRFDVHWRAPRITAIQLALLPHCYLAGRQDGADIGRLESESNDWRYPSRTFEVRRPEQRR